MDVLDFSHMPPLQSNRKVLDVLHEEILKNMGGASKTAKAVEPAACFAMADLSTIGGKACEVGASDGPTNSPTCHHVLQAGIVRPSLGLNGIIHKVHDPVHLPLALVPGQGVHQEPVVQDHLDQVPMLDLMLDPKHLQKVAVLMGQDILILHHLR